MNKKKNKILLKLLKRWILNDDGFLSKKKLNLLFENIALDIDEDLIDEFFLYADKDRDDKINLGEFLIFMKEKS